MNIEQRSKPKVAVHPGFDKQTGLMCLYNFFIFLYHSLSIVVSYKLYGNFNLNSCYFESHAICFVVQPAVELQRSPGWASVFCCMFPTGFTRSSLSSGTGMGGSKNMERFLGVWRSQLKECSTHQTLFFFLNAILIYSCLKKVSS